MVNLWSWSGSDVGTNGRGVEDVVDSCWIKSGVGTKGAGLGTGTGTGTSSNSESLGCSEEWTSVSGTSSSRRLSSIWKNCNVNYFAKILLFLLRESNYQVSVNESFEILLWPVLLQVNDRNILEDYFKIVLEVLIFLTFFWAISVEPCRYLIWDGICVKARLRIAMWNISEWN